MNSTQLRAARAILRWNLDSLAEKTGITRVTLNNFENDKTIPNKSTLTKIQKVLEESGIEIIEGGARKSQKIVEVLEGQDCYLRILDQILRDKPKEVLFFGADERRSTPESIKRLAAIRKSATKLKSLIKHNDDYVMGDLQEYRWMPEGMFVDGDVKAIWGDNVAYFMSWFSPPRIIKITDSNIAQHDERFFNYLWNEAEGPKKSSSEIKYD